jgi:hypothetical protein
LQGLAPLLAVLVVAALVLAVRRRDVTALVAPAAFGSVSVFSAVVLLLHSSFGWLRFQIAVIPLAAVLAGTVVAAAGPGCGAWRPRPSRCAWPWRCPRSFRTLTDTSTGLAREESPMLHSTFSPQQATSRSGAACSSSTPNGRSPPKSTGSTPVRAAC